MLRRSLVTTVLSLSMMAAAPAALAAQGPEGVRPAGVPSKDSWGHWFKAPSNKYKDLKCRLYASVTGGSKVRFRGYAECNHNEPITVYVNGTRDGHITATSGRQCHGTSNWCDVVHTENNKKGKQKWCAVTSSVAINGWYPGPSVTPARPCVTY